MAIVKTLPARKIINGHLIETSEISVVSETEYKTNGESCIVVRGIPFCKLTLDSKTSDHLVVKSMTKLTIVPDWGKIDEEYDEIILDKYACVEFRYISGNWYILSSDGLKQS